MSKFALLVVVRSALACAVVALSLMSGQVYAHEILISNGPALRGVQQHRPRNYSLPHSLPQSFSITDLNDALRKRAEQRRQELINEGRLGVTSEFSNVNYNIMKDLETPSSFGETFTKTVEVSSAADLGTLHKAVAEALSHDYSIVRFNSPAWRVETDFDGVEPPYLDQFEQVDATHGQYKPTDNVMTFSVSPSSVMQDKPWYDDSATSLLGFGEHAQRKLRRDEAGANRAAKHLVLYVNQGECLYFAHALANVLPRVTSVLQGARDAGYKVSAVVPENARAYSNENTERMLNALGVDLLSESPSTPHQTALLSQVASWSPYMKQLMQQELRRGLMGGLQAKDCSERKPSSGVFLSRAHGANNGRWLEGSEILEKKLQDQGFEVKDNLREIPLQDLARDLYQNHCTLAGFAGGNLLNLMFLPDKAKVVEYNPSRIYADRWIFVKALGLDWVHNVPAKIDEASADQLVQLAL